MSPFIPLIIFVYIQDVMFYTNINVKYNTYTLFTCAPFNIIFFFNLSFSADGKLLHMFDVKNYKQIEIYSMNGQSVHV